jgi:hypothetical protein
MTSKDSKIAEFQALSSSNYSVLNHFWAVMSQAPETQDGTRLSIQLQSEGPNASAIVLDFETVIEIRVNSLNNRKGYSIEIQPIQDKKWEDGNYAVSDVGQKAFSFICKDFKILNLGPRLPPEQKYCSFCGKSKDEVKKMVAGLGVYICNECVSLSVGIMLDQANPVENK